MNQTGNEIIHFRWIKWLTFLAGAVNIGTIVIFGTTITHYTGNLCNAAIALVSGQLLVFARLISYIVLFFLGSTISGILFHEQKLSFKRYYAFIPIFFGVMILIVSKMTANKLVILGMFAFGMGIQNGTHIKFRGVLVRTTHMTGYITDAAFSLGAVLRGHREELWKLKFYLLSIITFFAGGITYAVLIKLRSSSTIEILALLYILLGIDIAVGFKTEPAEEDLTYGPALQAINTQQRSL